MIPRCAADTNSLLAALWLSSLGLLAACGGQETAPADSARGNSKQQARETTSASKPTLFDEHGRLKPSGLKITWLDIPMGFANVGTRPQHHTFRSDEVTVSQLREFLSARMLTGRVDEMGPGASYHEVMPLSADPKAMRFDILVSPIDEGRGTLFSLEERTFLGAEPLSPKEAAAVLAREQAVAE